MSSLPPQSVNGASLTGVDRLHQNSLAGLNLLRQISLENICNSQVSDGSSLTSLHPFLPVSKGGKTLPDSQADRLRGNLGNIFPALDILFRRAQQIA